MTIVKFIPTGREMFFTVLGYSLAITVVMSIVINSGVFQDLGECQQKIRSLDSK